MAQEVVVGVVAITETDMVALAQEGYSGEASMILKLVLRGGEMYSLHEHQRCSPQNVSSPSAIEIVSR